MALDASAPSPHPLPRVRVATLPWPAALFGALFSFAAKRMRDG